VPAFLAAVVALLLTPVAPAAQAQALAGVGLTITPVFPSSVTVGQTGAPAELRITNVSGGVGPVTLSNITLTPSCSVNVAPCPAASVDAGVFGLSATGLGKVGTACAGTVFTIAPIAADPNGRYSFTPSTPVVLSLPGPGCDILFTLNVLAPPIDSDPAVPGLQTRQFASVSESAQTLVAPITTLNGTGTGSSITTVALPVPTISVTKTALPTTRPAPGGSFTFTVVVTNTSTGTGAGPVTVTALMDNVYGDLNGRGTCAIGAILPLAGTYTCSFAGLFNGVAGNSQTDTVTATVVDAFGTTAFATAPATVTLTAALPTIAVVKTATPLTRPAPTGSFTFNVVVTNTTAAPLTITALTDDKYPIATLGGCTTAVGTVLAATPGPGNTYSCSFVGTFTGVSGASQTDTVTVTAVNAAGASATASANATVTLTPAVVVPITLTTQAADGVRVGSPISDTATLAGAVAPTGTITFALFGPSNATCSGTPIFTKVVTVTGNGDYASGPFTPTAPGTYNWRATYSGDASNAAAGPGACGEAGEVSQVLPLPTITIVKTATPATRPEPGGKFTFHVTITNTSAEPLLLTSLTDNVYGNLRDPAKATCTVTGKVIDCTFDGSFTGKAGDKQTDTVTAVATAIDGVTVTATAQATVSLTAVTKPGGTLPRTGLVSAKLATFAGELILAGGLMLIAGRWVSAPSALNSRLGAIVRPRRRRRR